MAEQLNSVGIDVGTSTTQLIFSRLTVENRATAYSVPDMQISGREVIYRSPISFTPLLSETRLDAPGIREIVAREYRNAGVRPADIATGAIIITGETARKENARAVLEELKTFAGEFVVATAGPDLESVLAAKGAGAEAYARQTGKPILHMDIGGGTSNLALIEGGKITQTGCLNVGGRLIRTGNGAITYVSPVLRSLCALRAGMPVELTALENVVQQLVHALESAAGRNALPVPESLLTNRLISLPPGQIIPSFSGGVADLIDHSPADDFAYGDIGVLLGRAIRKSALCAGQYLLGRETIRATVIGAGCHSTQLSGSTVFARNVAFPLQNLPVICLTEQEQNAPAAALHRRIHVLRQRWETGPVAIFLPGLLSPSYDALLDLAQRLAKILPELPAPRVIVTGTDMAKALGQALATQVTGPLLCLDGLSLPEESFLDVAAPVSGGVAYPVVIKSLVLQ